MKYQEYRVLNKKYPHALFQFKVHINNGGLIRSLGIKVFFALGFLPGFKFIPFLGALSEKTHSLFLGHATECDWKNRDNNSNLSQNSSQNEVYDWIIIGSGPGAATAALKIPSNDSILVLEEGVYPSTELQNQHTLEQVMEEFKRAGQELILSYPIAQFAQGSVVGGGSEVNSGLFHKLPLIKQSEFLRRAKVTEREFAVSQDYISELLSPVKSDFDSNKSLVYRGGSKLSLEVENIPRWRIYSNNRSFVHNGMYNLVWKKMLGKENFDLKTGVSVTKLKKTREGIFSVSGFQRDGTRETFLSNRVVIAAGTIGTPFLLAQNRFIKWREIKFQWHPMIRLVTETDSDDLGFQDVDPYQAWTSDLRFKFGSAVSTPGLLAVNLGKFLNDKQVRNLRSYYVSFVSTGRGGLIPFTKTPWYFFSAEDRDNIKSGKKLLEELILAGGGKTILSSKSSKIALSTVHIFGSLPIDSTKYLDGTIELSNAPGVYVADASILPMGPGVNPQAVVMSLVHSKFLPQVVN